MLHFVLENLSIYRVGYVQLGPGPNRYTDTKEPLYFSGVHVRSATMSILLNCFLSMAALIQTLNTGIYVSLLCLTMNLERRNNEENSC